MMFATSGSSGERGKHKIRLCCLSNPVPGVSHNGFPSMSTKEGPKLSVTSSKRSSESKQSLRLVLTT